MPGPRWNEFIRRTGLAEETAEAVRKFSAEPANEKRILAFKAAIYDPEAIAAVPEELNKPTADAALSALAAALRAIPDGEARCRRRGYPVRIFHEALADVGVWSRHCRHNTGFHGLAGIGAVWTAESYQIRVAQFGRLQCNLEHIYRGEPVCDAAGRAVLQAGDNVINLHIPEAGPMTPEACLKSMRRMRRFFEKYRGDYDWKGGFCHSWLLDPALAAFLPKSSNIVRFQELGIRVADAEASDIEFRIFGNGGAASVREPNRFQQAIAAALAAGTKFHMGKLFIPREIFGGGQSGSVQLP